MKQLTFFLLILFAVSCQDAPYIDVPIEESPPADIGLDISDLDKPYSLRIIGESDDLSYFIEDGLVIVADPTKIRTVALEGGGTVDVQKLFEVAPQIEGLLTSNSVVNYGKLSDLPPNLKEFDVGKGEIDANINIPFGVEIFRMTAGHKVAVNIETLPISLKYFCLADNRSYGNIGPNFPGGMKRFVVMGENQIGGDYGLIKGKFPQAFAIKGLNQISDYTPHQVDFSATTMKDFIHKGSPGYGFDSDEVDKLLIDLATAKWEDPKRIEITGSHARPTEKSINAINSLKAQGVNIQTK